MLYAFMGPAEQLTEKDAANAIEKEGRGQAMKQKQRKRSKHSIWMRAAACAMAAAMFAGCGQVAQSESAAPSAPAQSAVTSSAQPDSSTTASAENTDEAALVFETPVASMPSQLQIDVPYLSQEDLLPTGCEIVSAMMLMQFWGVNRSVEEVLQAVPIGELTEEDGVLVGPDPNQMFVGDPRTQGGYGCFPPVVQQFMQELMGESYAVLDVTGTSLDELCSTYLARQQPVLVWASINMVAIEDGAEWRLRGTQETFTWPANEHCMVLTGYHADSYFLNDPYKGNGKIEIDRDTLEARYQDMQQRAVVVVPLAAADER